jgi:PAS domain S-box-containing protein
MINLLKRLFSSDGFMPHGHCYMWKPSMVWLHVVSDGFIALAYLTIPVTLIYIARKRKDIPFDWMFACFGIFILACGATHALEIWTIWTPTYWLLGSVKAITALASVATAILLVKLIPQLLSIPSSLRLRTVNAILKQEIGERRCSEERLVRSAALLRVAGDTAHLGGWSYRLPGHTLSLSDEACAIHEVPPGYTPALAEAIGFYAPEDRAEVTRRIEACIQDGAPFDFEVRFITAKDQRLWVRFIGEAVREETGEISSIQGAIQDISNRKRGEEALREKDALARIAGRVTRTGGWVMEAPWQNLSWSEELYHILEYPSDHVPQLAEGLALYPDPWRGKISA